MEPITVVIADDHSLFRDGLAGLLNSVEGIKVLGKAATGDEIIALAKTMQPDVILMDIKMPGINGIEATRQIVRVSPHIGILILTMFEDNDSIFSAMRAGARGYLLKGADQSELLRAIHAVNNGEAIFSPSIAQHVIKYFGSPQPAVLPEIFPELTAREREVLTLIASGSNNTQIAETLVLSPKTVRNHISNIFSKLQISDRAQAIIMAREAGLLRSSNAQSSD